VHPEDRDTVDQAMESCRQNVLDRMGAALDRSAREHREIAVLFCHLVGFKHVNDTAGHAAGDAVLIEAATRLSGVLRQRDTVARVGGDEFVIVIEPWNRERVNGAPDPDPDAERGRSFSLKVADRVVEALRAPFRVDGKEHAITIIIGIAYSSEAPGGSPAPGESRLMSAADVVAEADAAMYRAKHMGKNRVEVSAVSQNRDEERDAGAGVGATRD
jgi:GGDEF domain-containing protein